MQIRRTLKSAVSAGTCLAFCAAVPLALAQDGPDRIVIEHENLFPQGIVYDAAGTRFLVSSMTGGTIFAVANDGTLTPFITDEDLTSAGSIFIDAANNMLYVVRANRGFGGLGFGGQRPEGTPPFGGQFPAGTPEPGQASQGFSEASAEASDLSFSLLAYDLTTGEPIRAVDLTDVVPDDSPHLGNDLTVDAAGNVYVTDSLGGVVYMVDPEGNTYYLEPEAFSGQADSQRVGLTGIAYHPDGYLLVAQAAQGTLWKIPLDNPANVMQVALAEPLVGMNDMVFDAAGHLVVLTGGRAASAGVLLLSSDDGWASATVVDQASLDSTAIALTTRGNDVYVVSGGGNLLFQPPASAAGDSTPAAPLDNSPDSLPTTFEIVRVAVGE